MSYKPSITRCKNEIAEFSKGLESQDIEWIRQRLEAAHHKTLLKCTSDEEREYTLLFRISMMLYLIQRHKPSNIRGYVEKQLKEDEYIEKLKSFMYLTDSLNLGDEKKCDEIEKELTEFLKKADIEFPGFSEDNSRFISELHGDLIAVRSEGKRGSSRMLMRLIGQRLERERKK